jgi:prolipoprotein diacylglyceryltransferase
MVSSFILFLVLVWLSKGTRRSGFLALFFGVWYGSVRVVTDFLRVDKRYWGLTGSQILAGAVVLVSLYLLARYRGVPATWELSEPESSASGPE